MAQRRRRTRAASQFFIITGPNGTNLDGNPSYTIFGNVVERSRRRAEDQRTMPIEDPYDGDQRPRPTQAVYIDSVTIDRRARRRRRRRLVAPAASQRVDRRRGSSAFVSSSAKLARTPVRARSASVVVGEAPGRPGGLVDVGEPRPEHRRVVGVQRDHDARVAQTQERVCPRATAYDARRDVRDGETSSGIRSVASRSTSRGRRSRARRVRSGPAGSARASARRSRARPTRRREGPTAGRRPSRRGSAGRTAPIVARLAARAVQRHDPVVRRTSARPRACARPASIPRSRTTSGVSRTTTVPWSRAPAARPSSIASIGDEPVLAERGRMVPRA